MRFLHRVLGRRDPVLLELLEQAGKNAARATSQLRELVAGYPEAAPLAHEVRLCEQQGDSITREIIHRLLTTNARRSLGGHDGVALATQLDDIVDHSEHVADILGLYAIEAPMEHAILLADTLADAGAELHDALARLRTGEDYAVALTNIRRLEKEGDRLVRDGLANLFMTGIDPMVVIRWKDIFESLEQAVDSCQGVAHVLEGLAMRRGKSRASLSDQRSPLDLSRAQSHQLSRAEQ